MKPKIWIWALFGLTALIFKGVAQTPSYIQFTQKNGFPASTIYSEIVQDAEGILWIPTDRGLVRHDGQSFSIVPLQAGLNREFIDCKIDKNGTLWILNNLSELLYKPFDSDSIRHVFPSNTDKKIVNVNLQGTGIAENHLWFSINSENRNRIARLNVESLRLDITEFPSGRILAKDNSIFYYKHPKLYEIVNRKNSPVLRTVLETDQKGSASIFDSHLKNKIVLMDEYHGNHSKLYQYETINTLNGFSLADNITDQRVHHNCILAGTDLLWASPFGILHMDTISFRIARAKNSAPPIHSNEIFSDQEGGTWVGTMEDGLLYFPMITSGAVAKSHCFGEEGISSMLPSKKTGELWIGTLEGNVYLVDKNGDCIDAISVGQKDQIYEITQDVDHLLIANNSRSILYNLANRRFEEPPTNAFGVKQIESVAQNKYLIVEGSTVNIYDIGKAPLTATSLHAVIDRSYKLQRDTVNNRIWCVGSKKSYYYDISRGLFEEIKINHNDQIEDLDVTQDSTLWLLSESKLMSFYKGSLDHVDLGLFDLGFQNTIISDANHLYIGTSKGVYIIDYKKKRIIDVINRSDGLLDEGVTTLALVDRTLYMATSSGLYTIDLDGLKKNKAPPKIFIRSFDVSGQVFNISQDHQLPYDQNDITITFGSISHRAQGLDKRKYRLLGYETKWNYIDSKTNELRFPNLAPGNYTFQIVAINEDLVESIRPAEVTFIIKKPLWQQLPFILGLITVFSSVIIGVISWRQRRQQQRHIRELNLLRELDQFKERSLRNQMNPHFLFNSMNSILQFLLKNDKVASMNYLSQFSQLMRHVFEYSEKEEISMEEEISFLKNYLSLEKLRFGDQVNIQFNVDTSLPLNYITIPPLLIQPLIENTFKHAFLHKKGKGNLIIDVKSISKNEIQVLIKDDGIGRKKAGEFNKTKLYQPKRKIASSDNIRTRLAHYNKKNAAIGQQIFLNITDIEKENTGERGTTVQVNIIYN